MSCGSGDQCYWLEFATQLVIKMEGVTLEKGYNYINKYIKEFIHIHVHIFRRGVQLNIHTHDLSLSLSLLNLSLSATDPTQVNDVCFKDCSIREHSPVCGNDGVLYNNILSETAKLLPSTRPAATKDQTSRG